MLKVEILKNKQILEKQKTALKYLIKAGKYT